MTQDTRDPKVGPGDERVKAFKDALIEATYRDGAGAKFVTHATRLFSKALGVGISGNVAGFSSRA